ncbi:class I SAM-dependent methyltransferase [Bacteroidota bacterium]
MNGKDWILASALIAIMILLYFIADSMAVIFGIAVLLILVIYSYKSFSNKLTNSDKNTLNLFNQLESLFSVYDNIDLNFPLPKFGVWAISPDLAQLITTIVLEKRPKFILETGSGISSLIIGYCLKKNGLGRLISLEHQEEYMWKNSSAVEQHQLKEYVEILYTPLKNIQINKKNWLWYDFNTDKKIDLLIVDGPPKTTQHHARYPALPEFFDYLSDEAIIILDDAARPDEREIIDLWLEKYPCFDYEYHDLDRGAVLLKRKPILKS